MVCIHISNVIIAIIIIISFTLDFAPCEYYPETNSVDCDRFIPIENIHNGFKRLSASVPFIQLETFVLNTRNSEEIPKDLIGNSKIARIAIYCDSSFGRDLRVNLNAFKSTEKYTKEFLIQSCPLRRINFSFLNDFDNLVELTIDGSYHLEDSISSLPILNSLKTLSITYRTLTTFNASSFLDRLQRMNKSNGIINLRESKHIKVSSSFMLKSIILFLYYCNFQIGLTAARLFVTMPG